jgi:hypothetical protein
MPPEQDDQRDRQLEVIRRYVAELGTSRQRDHDDGLPGLPAPPEGERRWPAGPVLLIVLGLVTAALLGGFVIGRSSKPDSTGSAAHTGNSAVASVTSTTTTTATAAPAASAECKTAVDRANRSLAHAVEVQQNLAEHTKTMNDLLKGKIDGATALKTGMPSLIRGAAASSKFDIALADYKQVVDQCKLQAS